MKYLVIVVLMISLISACKQKAPKKPVPMVKTEINIIKIAIDTDQYYHMTFKCKYGLYTIQVSDYDIHTTNGSQSFAKHGKNNKSPRGWGSWDYYLTDADVAKAEYITIDN